MLPMIGKHEIFLGRLRRGGRKLWKLWKLW